MSAVGRYQPITVDDYLAGEQHARHKHEYVEGVVYAMVGATNAHNLIATNATILLGSQLRGKPCRVFNSDTKVRLRRDRGTRFYYPDAMVVCLLNPQTDNFQDFPVVIVEVISQTTRRADENEKREAYLNIDSLNVYMMIEQTHCSVLVYRRTDQGFVREVYCEMSDVVELPEIGCLLRLSELYETVEFTPEPTEED